MANEKTCILEGCNSKTLARKMCSAHYQKWQKYGDPLGGRPAKQAHCDQCELPVVSRNMCKAHYSKWWKDNSTTTFDPDRKNAKAVIGYAGAHYRVIRTKGKAQNFPCVDCGGSAKDWSLNVDADIRVDTTTVNAGQWYSMDVDDYAARCRLCHFSYDIKHGLMRNPMGRPKKVAA